MEAELWHSGKGGGAMVSFHRLVGPQRNVVIVLDKGLRQMVVVEMAGGMWLLIALDKGLRRMVVVKVASGTWYWKC
jgi:hypothetical protein